MEDDDIYSEYPDHRRHEQLEMAPGDEVTVFANDIDMTEDILLIEIVEDGNSADVKETPPIEEADIREYEKFGQIRPVGEDDEMQCEKTRSLYEWFYPETSDEKKRRRLFLSKTSGPMNTEYQCPPLSKDNKERGFRHAEDHFFVLSTKMLEKDCEQKVLRNAVSAGGVHTDDFPALFDELHGDILGCHMNLLSSSEKKWFIAMVLTSTQTAQNALDFFQIRYPDTDVEKHGYHMENVGDGSGPHCIKEKYEFHPSITQGSLQQSCCLYMPNVGIEVVKDLFCASSHHILSLKFELRAPAKGKLMFVEVLFDTVEAKNEAHDFMRICTSPEVYNKITAKPPMEVLRKRKGFDQRISPRGKALALLNLSLDETDHEDLRPFWKRFPNATDIFAPRNKDGSFKRYVLVWISCPLNQRVVDIDNMKYMASVRRFVAPIGATCYDIEHALDLRNGTKQRPSCLRKKLMNDLKKIRFHLHWGIDLEHGDPDLVKDDLEKLKKYAKICGDMIERCTWLNEEFQKLINTPPYKVGNEQSKLWELAKKLYHYNMGKEDSGSNIQSGKQQPKNEGSTPQVQDTQPLSSGTYKEDKRRQTKKRGSTKQANRTQPHNGGYDDKQHLNNKGCYPQVQDMQPWNSGTCQEHKKRQTQNSGSTEQENRTQLHNGVSDDKQQPKNKGCYPQVQDTQPRNSGTYQEDKKRQMQNSGSTKQENRMQLHNGGYDDKQQPKNKGCFPQVQDTQPRNSGTYQEDKKRETQNSGSTKQENRTQLHNGGYDDKQQPKNKGCSPRVQDTQPRSSGTYQEDKKWQMQNSGSTKQENRTQPHNGGYDDKQQPKNKGCSPQVQGMQPRSSGSYQEDKKQQTQKSGSTKQSNRTQPHNGGSDGKQQPKNKGCTPQVQDTQPRSSDTYQEDKKRQTQNNGSTKQENRTQLHNGGYDDKQQPKNKEDKKREMQNKGSTKQENRTQLHNGGYDDKQQPKNKEDKKRETRKKGSTKQATKTQPHNGGSDDERAKSHHPLNSGSNRHAKKPHPQDSESDRHAKKRQLRNSERSEDSKTRRHQNGTMDRAKRRNDRHGQKVTSKRKAENDPRESLRLSRQRLPWKRPRHDDNYRRRQSRLGRDDRRDPPHSSTSTPMGKLNSCQDVWGAALGISDNTTGGHMGMGHRTTGGLRSRDYKPRGHNALGLGPSGARYMNSERDRSPPEGRCQSDQAMDTNNSPPSDALQLGEAQSHSQDTLQQASPSPLPPVQGSDSPPTPHQSCVSPGLYQYHRYHAAYPTGAGVTWQTRRGYQHRDPYDAHPNESGQSNTFDSSENDTLAPEDEKKRQAVSFLFQLSSLLKK